MKKSNSNNSSTTTNSGYEELALSTYVTIL